MKNRMKVEFLNSVITQLMMRMKAASVKRFGKILLSFLFFLQTLVIPLSVAGGVLCISESHIAIEFRQATNDCHNDTISFKNFKIETEYHQDGCADIPLIQHEKNLILKKKQKADVQSLFRFVSADSVKLETGVKKNISQFTPLLKTVNLLQSVILLI